MGDRLLRKKLTVQDENGPGRRAVLTLAGQLDIAGVPDLNSELSEILPGTDGDVLVDLSGLEFIDSSGLSVLLGAERRLARNDRSLLLVAPTGVVLRTLELSGLDTVFRMYESREAAEAASR